MSKKKMDVTAITNELHGASLFFRSNPLEPLDMPKEPVIETTSEVTRTLTPDTTHARDLPREPSREVSHEPLFDLPTRDEIQEFSFRLRDRLKVKVQAEVPHEWQGELEEIALRLRVGKLELYRFIFAEFLGKVKRSSKQ